MDDLSILGPEFYQDINLDGTGRAHTVHTFNVDIRASLASDIGAEDTGSNKVKITTITNQNWELLEHRGRIVASNIYYLAYALKGSKGCVLRLIRRDNTFRALFKGFVGSVMDVTFCHSRSNRLACVDEGGNLYVWDLDKANTEATAQTDAMKITVQRGSTVIAGEHRLVWSPHIQSDEEDEEEQDIFNLVITHANCVEVFDVHHIFSKYSSGSIVPKEQLSCNYFKLSDAHEGDILDLSLSPDGSVLATAGVDGCLKFWPVNLEAHVQEQPKYLHNFKPHKGAPVTRLIFCDNHLCQDPNNQFWRFLITASSGNSEVKIWCTVNWRCLQSIRFLSPNNGPDSVHPSMLINMDLSASYLIVADSKRKAFYILQLMTDLALGDASVTSVTEYLLTQPILSFVVCGCAAIPERMDRDEYSDGDSMDEDEGGESAVTMREGLFDTRRNVAMIKLHCVHTRSMQELLVRFEPPDLFGVPPSKEHSKLNLPPGQHNSSTSELASASLQPMSTSQQAEPSLPNDMATPTTLEINTPPKSTLTHSPMAHSPKLLTPSDITSGKHDSMSLLSPADIRASVSSSSGTDPNTAQDWPAFNPLDNSVTDTVASLSLDAGSNAADSSLFNAYQSPGGQAAGDLIGAVTPPSIPDSEDEVKSKSTNDVIGVGEEGEKGLQSFFLASDLLQLDTDSQKMAKEKEEETEPTEEEAKQAFVDMMHILQIDKQKIPGTHELPPQTFQEFAELINNPDKMRAEKQRIEDSVEALPDLVDDEEMENQSSFASDNKHEDNKKILENIPFENVAMVEATGTSVDKEECELPNQGSVMGTEASVEDASMEMTSSGGVESSVDLEDGTTNPEAPQDLSTTFQEVSKENNRLDEQEAPDAEGVPEAGNVLGDESNETCGALTGTEEKLTMPCALSDPLFQTASSSPSVKGIATKSTLPEATPTETAPAATSSIEVKCVDISHSEAAETQGENATAKNTPIENENIESTTVSLAAKTKEAPTPVLPTQETNKTNTKQKKRKRSKKTKKEANTVDAAEVEDRLSDVEVSGSDSQLILVEPPQTSLAQLNPQHQEPALEMVATTGLPTSQQDVMLSQLSQLLASQKELIEKMESEQHTTRVAMQVEVQRLREGLLEEQKAILAEFKREQQSRFDRIMKEKQSLDKAKQDKLISSISQTLTTAVQTKLDRLVKTEMKNIVVPAVNESMLSVRVELSKNVSHCITQTNDAIRTRLAELTKSKEMSDTIGKAVSVHLQGALPAVLENIFKAVVLEPVEKAFQVMFKQIDETFRKGTMEYLLQLQQQEQQLQNNLFQHVDSSLQSLHSSLASAHNTAPVTAHIQDTIRQELTAFSQRMQENVLETVSRALHEEAANSSYKMSDREKAKVSQLLKSQQLNEAFELCLSTSDLPLVIFTCQQVDPDILFDCSPIPLSQAVLLSLIQQLSVDLLDNLEMKIKFLDPSVLALDVHDGVTKSHMAPVIKHLSEQLRVVQDKASSTSISPAILKQVKRLFQVTQHMCH